MSNPYLLDLKDLSVTYGTGKNKTIAIDKLSLQLKKGQVLSIVGESGCGKSTLALSIMNLLNKKQATADGHIFFQDKDLLKCNGKELQDIRGNKMSMIFQDPMTSLNPYLKIGLQITEQIIKHTKKTSKEAKEHAIKMLHSVGIPKPEDRFDRYPHEFSGGMRQRAMIACALSCNPQLLIADEPTTALDVTIQAQILKLIKDKINETKMSLLLITHDLGVVAGISDLVAVMYAGQIVEYGPVDEIYKKPQHPYTRSLLKAIPRLDHPKSQKLFNIEGQPPALHGQLKGCRFAPRCPYAKTECLENEIKIREISDQRYSRCLLNEFNPKDKLNLNIPKDTKSKDHSKILEIKDLSVTFELQKGLFSQPSFFKAVNQVSLSIQKGEILGLVGESGCGKSTLIRSIIQLIPLTSGQILFNDQLLRPNESKKNIFNFRKKVQMIFQDPFSSLNIRHKIGHIISEPILNFKLANKKEAIQRTKELMTLVGLKEEWIERYPHQFSGGQRQRIGIARALASKPELILCDEPVSALDVSVQSQIINLLKELKEKLNLSLLFISHDLSVVKQISDRIAVMYLGKIVESTTSETIYTGAKHPYTKSLLNAIPLPNPELEKSKDYSILQGELPSPEGIRIGCDFAPRCPMAKERCFKEKPILNDNAVHQFSCFYPLKMEDS